MDKLRAAVQAALDRIDLGLRGADDDCGDPRCSDCDPWRKDRALAEQLRSALAVHGDDENTSAERVRNPSENEQMESAFQEYLDMHGEPHELRGKVVHGYYDEEWDAFDFAWRAAMKKRDNAALRNEIAYLTTRIDDLAYALSMALDRIVALEQREKNSD